MKDRSLVLVALAVVAVGLTVLWLSINRAGPAQAQASAAIYASPIHGGCYIAGPSDCRLHVEPFTINLASGKKLVYFQLFANRVGGASRVIYDFRPDQSNPLPYSGSTVSPSLVAQDFAATCGAAYYINLLGRDTGDAASYNLGATGVFTCPTMVP